mgnify:CR=1 FL=1
MTIEIKFRKYVLLTLALLASTLVLSGTVLATDYRSDILENVSCDKNSLRFAKILDDFETVTANPEVFLEDVADGKVKLKLLEKEFDLELENTHVVSDDAKFLIENETGTYTIPAAKINTYRGKVIGEENSSAGFAVSDEALIGHIEVGNIYYTIELTNKTMGGKAILVIYSSDNIKKHENEEIAFCGVEEQPSLEELYNIKKSSNIKEDWSGIDLEYSTENTLYDNTANFNNNSGIYLVESGDNKLDYNNASNNAEYGININNSSRNNILTGNIANSNGKEDIHVVDPENNTINGLAQELPFQGSVMTIITIITIALIRVKHL